MKLISIVTPCYNEEGNVHEVHERVRAVMDTLPAYRYEHIFIDNASRDATVAILKEIAASDRNVKIIVNSRNFGHIRSPMHAIYEARGDAVAVLLSDLQDPPELLRDMILDWERGVPIVVGIKETSEESSLMFWVRTCYYRLVNRLTDLETYEHFTGFGLYDRKVIDILRTQFRDPYPYFRGMIAEIGLPHVKLYYQTEAALARSHEEQLLHALRQRDAGHHESVQGALAGFHFRWVRSLAGQPVYGDLLSDLQAGVLEQLYARHSPDRDWRVSSSCRFR